MALVLVLGVLIYRSAQPPDLTDAIKAKAAHARQRWNYNRPQQPP
jgi:hypothetical protein